jgi:hypothetical protein
MLCYRLTKDDHYKENREKRRRNVLKNESLEFQSTERILASKIK